MSSTTPHRTNPGHWIWKEHLPKRFEPSEGAYLALRHLMTEDHQDEMRARLEDLMDEGMSAEQIVRLCRLDATMPAEVVDVYGAALAYWIERRDEH